MIIHNLHKRQKEVASISILCEFAHHGVQSCSSDITLQRVLGIEFLQLNHEEKHPGHLSYTFTCMWKDLQQKGEIHQIVSPFECRTADISSVDSNIECFSNLWWNKFVNMDRGICVTNNAMSTISSMK
jgi:hypothetical protein